MKLMAFFALLCVPQLTFAYLTAVTDISEPYEIVPIEVIAPAQISFLGTLDDYPVMYEVTSEEPFTFSAQVWQPNQTTEQPLSLLLIRKNDRGGGVAEVTRMSVSPADWARQNDRVLGMSFAVSPEIRENVEPGTYRIEVSSPDNQAQYLLRIGDQRAELGYFATLGVVRQTQAYFGYGIFSMLKSSYVYYPIGILLLLFAIFKTWQYRHTLRPHRA